ncbi:hypothetical protein Slin15195_G091010 [Septoria linicola]|uniref:Uncharacterized protein n=1 Tax=Septoria linicola TaxID=215465 RepID=A0A9Q9B1M7_9PEZI|nr:hypothetical protein Slin15195_G091010 [Septoria linicola]
MAQIPLTTIKPTATRLPQGKTTKANTAEPTCRVRIWDGTAIDSAAARRSLPDDQFTFYYEQGKANTLEAQDKIELQRLKVFLQQPQAPDCSRWVNISGSSLKVLREIEAQYFDEQQCLTEPHSPRPASLRRTTDHGSQE